MKLARTRTECLATVKQRILNILIALDQLAWVVLTLSLIHI